MDFPSNLSKNSSFSGNISLSGPDAPWWEIALVSCTVMLTIVANFVLICAFFLDRRARTPFNYYLINLAVSDFLIGTMGMTNYAAYTFYNYWPWSYSRCTVWMYFDFLGCTIMLQTLAVIALERLWAVTFPASYRKYHTTKKALFVIAIIWTLSNVLIVPSLAYYRLYIGVFEDMNSCYWDSFLQPVYASPFIIIIVLFWIPVSLTIVAYLITTGMFCCRNHNRIGVTVNAVLGIPSQSQMRAAKKERQLYIILSLLLIALLVMWSPYFVYQALSMSTGYNNNEFFTVSYWMSYSLSAINPFLFNWRSPEMNMAVKKLSRMFRLKQSVDVVLPLRSSPAATRTDN